MAALFLLLFLQSLEFVAGTDIADALQSKIDAAERTGAAQVVIPDGVYQISKTIHVGRGDRFTKVSIRGESEGINYITRGGTSIQATFNDRPMFAVQGVRGVRIANLQLVGPSDKLQYMATPSQDVAEYAKHFPQHTNQQFVGIAIDPFSGDPPEPPRYDGAYNKRHSSMVEIADCQFRFLGCGVITKPSGGRGADAQGDYLLVDNCNFQFCQFGGSINGSQTRQSTFRDCKFWDCFTGVGMGQHGVGLCGNVLIDAGTFDRCGYGLLARKAGWANRISIRNTIGEGTACIADIRDGMGVCQVLIDGTAFTMPIENHYQWTAYHLRTDGCLLDFRDNIVRTYGESYRPTFLIRGSTEIQTAANIFRRASIDAKNSPIVAIVPTDHRTIIEGRNAPTRLPNQTRILGRAEWIAPRTIRGAKTLDCKSGEVYGVALIGDKPADVFRVVEATATSTTLELLNCGPDVNDKAATLLRLQDWANFVWKIQ